MRNPIEHVVLATTLAVTLATVAGAADNYDPPRTQSGKPDLEGVWSNASLTRLTRPSNLPDLVISPEQAAELAATNFHNVRAAADLLPADPDRGAPEVVKNLPPVGNYNAGWVDPGTAYGVVRGEIRSSWIVEPADGKIPFREGLGEERMERRKERSAMAGPEVMSHGERCLLGFGGTAGPPMLNVLYNNYYRIVQTEDHVMILVEMVHDARIIRLGAEHGPPTDRRWLGDSVGYWEGDTLVVETTHFHPERELEGPFLYSRDTVVTERFTRVAEDSMLYEFRVEDPTIYTAPIRGEMSFSAVSGRVYEYACHEGNYAMTNMLRGARLQEREEGASGQ